MTTPTSSDLRFLSKFASILGDPSFLHDISSALEEGSYEAEFVLLLTAATDLESLIIHIPSSELPAPDAPFFYSKGRDRHGSLVFKFLRLFTVKRQKSELFFPLTKIKGLIINPWFSEDKNY